MPKPKAPIINLYKHLKCPNCLEFAATPVLTCRNGHIICGICQDEIKKCPTCQDSRLYPNEFIDRILREEGTKVTCRNVDKGCNMKIKPSEMKIHIKYSCELRQIQCTEPTPLGSCDQHWYNPIDLVHHWIKFHHMEKIEVTLPIKKTYSITKRRKLDPTARTLLGSINVRQCMSRSYSEEATLLEADEKVYQAQYFELDDRTFLVHEHGMSNDMHTWITLMGNESEAKKYRFAATLSSSLCNSTPKRQVSFDQIPIHSLRHCSINDVEPTGHTASISYSSLKLLQDETPNQKFILDWNVRFDIYKI